MALSVGAGGSPCMATAGGRRRYGVGEGEVWEEAAAAEWTSGVRQQPFVDAVQVEGVFALGQQPEAVVVPELVQTDCAICAVLEPANGAVGESGQRVEVRLIQARVVRVEELLQLAMERAHVELWAVRPGGDVQLQQPVSPQKASQHVQESGEGDHHT